MLSCCGNGGPLALCSNNGFKPLLFGGCGGSETLPLYLCGGPNALFLTGGGCGPFALRCDPLTLCRSDGLESLPL